MIDQILKVDIWNEPLRQFAEATGVVVSLYDSNAKKRCGPYLKGPLVERLASSRFWSEDGRGSLAEEEACLRVTQNRDYDHQVQMNLLALAAIPLMLDEHVVGVFTLGWVPHQFADPVSSDSLARAVGLPSLEVWQLIRMQQPIPPEKMKLYAGLLRTLSAPLVKQLRIQAAEREKHRSLQIMSESALAFTSATTQNEIFEAAVAAIRRLVPHLHVSIKIQGAGSKTDEVTTFEGADPDDSIPNLLEATKTRSEEKMVIPVVAASGAKIGVIEIRSQSVYGDIELFTAPLSTLASQMAVALQKIRFLTDLEYERAALRDANQELQRLHQMKDEFLATLSHELRTPLNSILGWSQILKEEAVQSDYFVDAIDAIERNAVAQSHLIEDLLDVSRVISGKMILERNVVNVLDLLKDALKTVLPAAEAKSQKVHVRVPAEALFLKGDPTRLKQVFWNLLSNAVKFTPDQGHISVLLEPAGPYFRIEIKDSGKGIDAKFLPHLFDRFSQADSSHTRKFGGLGLGLAIVRHLVELHGGSVWAASDGEGLGATFTIYLPQNATDHELDKATDFVKDLEQAGADARKKLAGLKILLVDDEPDSLRLARFVLEKSGAQVSCVDNAQDGYRRLKEWRPDILVSDISMPGESGYDLIRRIRNLSPLEGGATPAVALTALAGNEPRKATLAAGFQAHFSKPYQPQALSEMIESLVSGKLRIPQ